MHNTFSSMKPIHTQVTVPLASLLLAAATLPLSADWVQVPLQDLTGGSALVVTDGRLFIGEADSASHLSTENLVDWMRAEPLRATSPSTGNGFPQPPGANDIETIQWMAGSVTYTYETGWHHVMVYGGYRYYTLSRNGEVLFRASTFGHTSSPQMENLYVSVAVDRIGTDIFVSFKENLRGCPKRC